MSCYEWYFKTPLSLSDLQTDNIQPLLMLPEVTEFIKVHVYCVMYIVTYMYTGIVIIVQVYYMYMYMYMYMYSLYKYIRATCRTNSFLLIGHYVLAYSYLFGHSLILVGQYRLIQVIILQLDRPQWQSILWNARLSQLLARKMANGQLLFLALVHVQCTCIHM